VTISGAAVPLDDGPPDRPALEPLWELAPDPTALLRGGGMPARLEDRYGGPLDVPLRSDGPTFIVNFVSTLDGVVALGPGQLTGGGLISGFHEPDRFVMGLVRSLADVVLVGAGTLRGSTSHRWTPDHIQPDFATAFRDWRRAMGLAPQPTTVIVSASGELPIRHPGLDDPTIPVVIATTQGGAARLEQGGLPAHVSVEAIGGGASLRADDILRSPACRGAKVVLCEGGPHLLADFVAADLVDELFLTLAPQLVGRDGGSRIGLVEGVALPPADARWHELASVRRSEDHLFLRYRRRAGRPDQKES
jgi:riboflavin biosynthesis pyrimidine reductase